MKLCPYPFSRLESSNFKGRRAFFNGTFIPCCTTWLTDEYFNLPKEDKLENIWNGQAAIEFRKKMYEGDFSFCNRHACKMPLFTVEEMADKNLLFAETPISEKNLTAITRKDPIMPEGPSSLTLISDLICNLKCPICRPSIIPNSAPSKEALEEYTFVHSKRESLEVVKMSNGGEVFYSTLQKKLLKSFNNQTFPKLRRIHIVSNGTLFNQKTYDDLLPGASFIKDVNISIDAGSKEVYEKVRGPYWEKVLSNVTWLGEMRKSNKLDFFSFHIIIVKDNYRDILNILELGRKCHVDRVLVQPYQLGPDQGYENYLEQAVHLACHPEHKEFLEILHTYKNDPLFYTTFNITGYENKISNDVDIKKAFALYLKAGELLNQDKAQEALRFIQESINLHPENYAYEKLSEIRKILNRVNEKT